MDGKDSVWINKKHSQGHKKLVEKTPCLSATSWMRKKKIKISCTSQKNTLLRSPFNIPYWRFVKVKQLLRTVSHPTPGQKHSTCVRCWNAYVPRRTRKQPRFWHGELVWPARPGISHYTPRKMPIIAKPLRYLFELKGVELSCLYLNLRFLTIFTNCKHSLLKEYLV